LRMPILVALSRWFHPLASSVYVGIAEEAREEAYKSLGTGINSAGRDPALTDVMLGEMEAAFLTAVSVRDQVLEAIKEPPTDPRWSLMQTVLLKEIVVSQSIVAVEIAGGRSYFRKSPLERLARDVRAGKFHPLSAPVSFQVAGQRGREMRGC